MVNAHAGAMPRILLVEDNPLHVRLVRSMLQDEWALTDDLHRVVSLTEGLKYLSSTEVDCVLLDLMLPDASGLEALVAIRDAFPDVPIVVLSAHEDEEMAASAIRGGAQDYLVKGSVDAAGLVRAIRYALVRNDETEIPEDADAAVVLTDPHGTILQADQGADGLLGLDLGQLVGTDLPQYIDAEHVRRFALALSAGGAVTARMRKVDGSRIDAVCVITALRDGHGRHTGSVVRVTEISAAEMTDAESVAVAAGWQ
ncbi:MAG: response regulator [Acidimicrobiia bacterium]|nr:response regulator [Acidimicrobiia bacterium]NNC74103.1 response regulator [Acidimicrobiia bacterium]